MSKYIDSEKLIAEIERLYDIARNASYNGEIEGEMTAYDKILSIIASLQQEQPEGNLEYWLEHFGMPKENIDNCITQIAQGYGACRYLEGVRHGAEAVNEFAKQEQPMPDSTQLIEWWHEDKEMLKEKDFRDDPWRLAYNAFMCGFGRGIAVKKQERPEVQDGKFVFPKYLYARTKDNKTIDMSYAPQDMTAIEYVRNDLFIITPEPEISEFEKRLFEIRHIAKRDMYSDEEWQTLRGEAAELFELAKNEILRSDKWIIGNDALRLTYERGKAEALKDLPRWMKCADCAPKPKYSNEWIFSIDSENVTRESAIVHKGYFLPLNRLEKLPGFNE